MIRSQGSAAYSAIFHSKLSVKLPGYVAAAVLPLGITVDELGPLITELSSGIPPTNLPGVNAQVIEAAGLAIVNAYNDSFSYIWIFSAALAAVSVIASLMLEPYSKFMDRK